MPDEKRYCFRSKAFTPYGPLANKDVKRCLRIGRTEKPDGGEADHAIIGSGVDREMNGSIARRQNPSNPPTFRRRRRWPLRADRIDCWIRLPLREFRSVGDRKGPKSDECALHQVGVVTD